MTPFESSSPFTVETTHQGLMSRAAFAGTEDLHLLLVRNVSDLNFLRSRCRLKLYQMLNYHNVDRHGPTAPLSEAFQTRLPPLAINPALVALPSTLNSDLQDPIKILKVKGRKATQKIGGVRTKEKPYSQKLSLSKGAKSLEAGPDSEEDDDTQQVRRGRPIRRGNYNQDDKSKLLRLIGKIVPLGHLSWTQVTALFNEWAKHHRHPERSDKLLELKFKAVRILIYF